MCFFLHLKRKSRSTHELKVEESHESPNQVLTVSVASTQYDREESFSFFLFTQDIAEVMAKIMFEVSRV